jgi:hypothetical protein
MFGQASVDTLKEAQGPMRDKGECVIEHVQQEARVLYTCCLVYVLFELTGGCSVVLYG